MKNSLLLRHFDQLLPQEKLNIIEKTRSNLFAWRGQFSPQLIEVLLKAYCPSDAVVLDPFAGSGTVLLEAGRLGLEAYGCEINPAAFTLISVYQLINDTHKKNKINWVRTFIDQEFPFIIFGNDQPVHDLREKIKKIRYNLDSQSKIIFDALIILLDIGQNPITNELIQVKFSSLVTLINNLPYSKQPIKIDLSDCRYLPLKNESIDFVVTSPPYINVFNYHQNYRKSAELLGWDILKIAKSEIGSNRANRKNRFYTVIQYCLDITESLRELSRVTKKQGRILLVVGYQSNVLGVPFYNADIIESLGVKTGLFCKVLRQNREFKNKFGKMIREDLIHFVNLGNICSKEKSDEIARQIAVDMLKNSLKVVAYKNISLLEDAIYKVNDIQSTPILDFS